MRDKNFTPCGPNGLPSRYQIYRHATGDTSWGKASIWLSDQYFKFCEDTNRTPTSMASPSGKPIAQIQPDEQKPFDAWLLKTYWPDYKNERTMPNDQ